MSFDNLQYVLWLPSWYPNKLSPYDGDFIQRHAQAASAFVPIHVLYIVKDKQKQITSSVLVDQQRTGNLLETIIYYSNPRFLFGITDKLFSLWNYKRLYRRFINELLLTRGLPWLVHVHIAFKAGIIANWIKKRYAIPFLLSEHWTIYLDEARPDLNELGFLKRRFISKTIANASKIISVSDYLGRSIKGKWPFVNYKVIPNVVNTNIFYPSDKKVHPVPRLLHISNLSYQKDPEQLFRALKLVKDKGIKFTLEVFGASRQLLNSLANDKQLGDMVILHEEVPQAVLAQHLRNADVLILYSRYETFGCVIIEANACGVPVIVADIPVMRELVNQDQNGVLVKPESAEALAEAVINVLQNKNQFNTQSIAETVIKYSYSTVGKMFLDEYLALLAPGSAAR